MKVLLTSQHGLDLVRSGKKIATTRYGVRIADYPPGEIIRFQSNINPDDFIRVKVEKYAVTSLGLLTNEDAIAAGNSSVQDAIREFARIYVELGREVTSGTPVTVIYFSPE